MIVGKLYKLTVKLIIVQFSCPVLSKGGILGYLGYPPRSATGKRKMEALKYSGVYSNVNIASAY